MMKGYYKQAYAVPCLDSDMHFFRRMMADIPIFWERHVFVRQVKVGDVLVSDTDVFRWRIISEDNKLYLGFYETPSEEKPYNGLERPKAYYVVEEDEREYSQQKYMLVRIPKWVALQVYGINK